MTDRRTNTARLKGVLDSEGRTGDHVVTLKPMTGRDMIALSSDDGTMAEVLTRLGAATVSHDFTNADGKPADILDQPFDTLRQLLAPWRIGSEEDALPQA